MKYLEGSLVKLVKFSEQHITANYMQWLNDSDINRFLNVGRLPVSIKNITVPNDEKNLMFAVITNIASEDKKLWGDVGFNYYVGTCSLHDIDWISRKAEIGYMIGSKEHWGIGIATEIVGLLTNYAFNRLNLNKVVAGVVDGNAGSIRALEKNGFKKFAVLEQEYYLDGKYLDTIRFHNFKSWQE